MVTRLVLSTLPHSVTATWDPGGGPDIGFDWWSRESLLVLSLVFVGILVLVFAGSWGFMGFVRKLDHEGRRVASGRWPGR